MQHKLIIGITWINVNHNSSAALKRAVISSCPSSNCFIILFIFCYLLTIFKEGKHI